MKRKAAGRVLGLTRIYGGKKTKGMEAKIQYHKKILKYSVFQYHDTEIFSTPKKNYPVKGNRTLAFL